MKLLHMAAFVLLVVGGLNWGLIALLKLNLGTLVLGSMPSLVTLVYVLVGVSAVYLAATHLTDCKVCSKK